MFSFSNLIIGNRIKKVLTRANIDVLHVIPGRIRLKSPIWKNDSPETLEIINKLSLEPEIKLIVLTHETGTLLIEFDVSVLKKPAILEEWVNQVEKTILNN